MTSLLPEQCARGQIGVLDFSRWSQIQVTDRSEIEEFRVELLRMLNFDLGLPKSLELGE